MESINPAIFRAYDIRGVVGETLTADDAYSIGRAFASFLKSNNQHQVIQAEDARLSSPELGEKLRAGLMDGGCDVIAIGVVPTPILYYAVNELDCHNGVMLTASHNPANYNGMKMLLNGQSLLPDDIQMLYQLIINDQLTTGEGSLVKQSITSDYIDRVIQGLELSRPFKIVLDCGNAIAGSVAPALFRKLGCEVIELYCDVDGRFPNHEPDPSELENLTDLRSAVAKHQADLGVALDGDADRVFILDHTGELVFPDVLLMLLAKFILPDHPGAKVVYDVKSTNQLSALVKSLGGEPVMSRTGHSFMKLKMKAINSILGGEASGHTFLRDQWYGFDDGMYVAARLITLLSKQTKTLHDLMSEFPKTIATPEYKCPMPDDEKFEFITRFSKQADFADGEKSLLDGLRVEWPYGWGLARVSNTSPYLTFRFEADSETALAEIKALFKDQLLSVKHDLIIPF